MAIAPDSLLDVAKVLAARVATAPVRKRHSATRLEERFDECERLIPSDWREPALIDRQINGYFVAVRAADALPREPMGSNLVHRTLALLADRCHSEMAAMRRAIEPFDEAIDLMSEALQTEQWQAPAPNDELSLPELPKMRRIGSALVARATLRIMNGQPEEAEKDIQAAFELTQKLQNCDGVLLHYIVGVALEVVIHKALRQMLRRQVSAEMAHECVAARPVTDPTSGLAKVMRSEFARVCIPRARSANGPWDPIPIGSPAQCELPALAIQWTLADHPAPYDAAATVTELVAIAEAFVSWVEEGWCVAPAMSELAKNYIGAWPEQLSCVPVARFNLSLRDLMKARQELRKVHNPYGNLTCARTIHAAAEVFRAGLVGDLRRKSTWVLAAATRLGHPPSCLEELVGNGLLEHVPIDPFTDMPLAYEVKDHAIWSPGPAGLGYGDVRRCNAGRYDSPYWLRI